MAELTPRERLQPCLLDRLTDESPGNPSESRDQRIVSPGRYREAVLRDLRNILNTTAKPPEDPINEFPEVAHSVVNYGICDVYGLLMDGLRVQQIESRVMESIKLFEPRISPSALKVTAVTDSKDADRQCLAFEIKGDLWAFPVPEALFIKTSFDLETSRCQVERSANG